MHNTHRISLNALRVFLHAARHKSFKTAAADLGVTPGAVSHQVRQLEDQLGLALFHRASNAIALTDAGTRLTEEAAPGLALLHGALDRLNRRARTLSVAVSTTFATRFLIPRLGRFKARHPGATIRVETLQDSGLAHDSDAEVIIAYIPGGAPSQGADVLFPDTCRPYLAPGLLDRLPPRPALGDIPALQCTRDNWDWTLWLSQAGRAHQPLRFGSQFDLDDSALRAAVAGLGMVLASGFLIADDLRAGRLVALPGTPEISLGQYVIRHAARETTLSRAFVAWLRSERAGA
ncbi:MAG: LysR substrate-binding domain-containing protein [Pseudomonadota bacterium]